MRTENLQGAALDWAVAKCEGMHVAMSRGGWFVFDSDAYSEFRNDYNDSKLQMFRPSTNWAQGGPIIERERITLDGTAILNQWMAVFYVPDEEPWEMRGPTPLIAAMRCYVASKLGDTIDLPKELTK
jgi:Protein of unknown function (DUF2591)